MKYQASRTSIAAFWGIGNSSGTQLGVPWNRAATSWTLLDPIQDSRTTAQSSLEFLPSSDACLVNNWASRIPIFATSSERPYSYHPVLKVLSDAFKRHYSPCIFCVFLAENSYFQCLVGDHIWTKPVIKSNSCVCVCVRDTQSKPNYPQCIRFRELFFAVGAVFQSTFLFQISREEERENYLFLHCFAPESRPPHSNVH